MEYKDEEGNKLYGFSQVNLEETNKQIKNTNRALQILITLFIILLIIILAFGFWLWKNDVITRIIYGY